MKKTIAGITWLTFLFFSGLSCKPHKEPDSKSTTKNVFWPSDNMDADDTAAIQKNRKESIDNYPVSGNKRFRMILASDPQFYRTEVDIEQYDKSKERVTAVMAAIGSEKSLHSDLLGVIVNGDLTEYGKDNQLREFLSIVQRNNIEIPIWPGLGNHDNANPVDNLDRNNGAHRMRYYITDFLRRNRALLYSYDISSGAYAFRIGKFVFIQANTTPFYEVSWLYQINHLASSRRESYTSPWDYIVKTAEEASNDGLYVIFNSHTHNGGEDYERWDHNALSELVKRTRIVAMFAGHWHEKLGLDTTSYTNALNRTVPVFYSGAMFYESYLKATFNQEDIIVESFWNPSEFNGYILADKSRLGQRIDLTNRSISANCGNVQKIHGSQTKHWCPAGFSTVYHPEKAAEAGCDADSRLCNKCIGYIGKEEKTLWTVNPSPLPVSCGGDATTIPEAPNGIHEAVGALIAAHGPRCAHKTDDNQVVLNECDVLRSHTFMHKLFPNSFIKQTGEGGWCMDANFDRKHPQPSTTNFVVMAPCDESRSYQRWTYDPDRKTMSNLAGGCLDTGQNDTNGAKLMTYVHCHGNTHQQFDFDKDMGMIRPSINPVDCVRSEPESWGACSVACGGGTQSGITHVITPASHGGNSCGSDRVSKECNTQACARGQHTVKIKVMASFSTKAGYLSHNTQTSPYLRNSRSSASDGKRWNATLKNGFFEISNNVATSKCIAQGGEAVSILGKPAWIPGYTDCTEASTWIIPEGTWGSMKNKNITTLCIARYTEITDIRSSKDAGLCGTTSFLVEVL